MVIRMDATTEWNEMSMGRDSAISTGVGIGMKALDRVLELLEDSEWHSLDETKAQIPLPEGKFAPILRFLADFGFITLEGERSVAKIKPLGLTFLELPVEQIFSRD